VPRPPRPSRPSSPSAEAEAGIEREESGPAEEGVGQGDVVSEPQDQGSGESMDSAEKG
jgi:large subunit ribosomal protein L25